MELKQYSAEVQARINNLMERRLAALDEAAPKLKEAMRYGLLLGGKRARPLLVYASGRAFGVAPERLDATAAAIECIHAYSLIHDDMPEMDNDLLRRGKPSVHAAFSPQLALLSGDALQALAFEFLADSPLPPAVVTKQLQLLAVNAGYSGMCGGQALDLQSEHQSIPYETLRTLHAKKTGALILAAVLMGAAAGNPSAAAVQALTRYAQKIGLAFQIWDDVLDVIGDSALTGKPVGNDEAAGKSTYPALFGLDKAKELALAAKDEALDALSQPVLAGCDTEVLQQFALFCVTRDH